MDKLESLELGLLTFALLPLVIERFYLEDMKRKIEACFDRYKNSNAQGTLHEMIHGTLSSCQKALNESIPTLSSIDQIYYSFSTALMTMSYQIERLRCELSEEQSSRRRGHRNLVLLVNSVQSHWNEHWFKDIKQAAFLDLYTLTYSLHSIYTPSHISNTIPLSNLLQPYQCEAWKTSLLINTLACMMYSSSLTTSSPTVADQKKNHWGRIYDCWRLTSEVLKMKLYWLENSPYESATTNTAAASAIANGTSSNMFHAIKTLCEGELRYVYIEAMKYAGFLQSRLFYQNPFTHSTCQYRQYTLDELTPLNIFTLEHGRMVKILIRRLKEYLEVFKKPTHQLYYRSNLQLINNNDFNLINNIDPLYELCKQQYLISKQLVENSLECLRIITHLSDVSGDRLDMTLLFNECWLLSYYTTATTHDTVIERLQIEYVLCKELTNHMNILPYWKLPMNKSNDMSRQLGYELLTSMTLLLDWKNMILSDRNDELHGYTYFNNNNKVLYLAYMAMINSMNLPIKVLNKALDDDFGSFSLDEDDNDTNLPNLDSILVTYQNDKHMIIQLVESWQILPLSAGKEVCDNVWIDRIVDIECSLIQLHLLTIIVNKALFKTNNEKDSPIISELLAYLNTLAIPLMALSDIAILSQLCAKLGIICESYGTNGQYNSINRQHETMLYVDIVEAYIVHRLTTLESIVICMQMLTYNTNIFDSYPLDCNLIKNELFPQLDMQCKHWQEIHGVWFDEIIKAVDIDSSTELVQWLHSPVSLDSRMKVLIDDEVLTRKISNEVCNGWYAEYSRVVRIEVLKSKAACRNPYKESAIAQLLYSNLY